MSTKRIRPITKEEMINDECQLAQNMIWLKQNHPELYNQAVKDYNMRKKGYE